MLNNANFRPSPPLERTKSCPQLGRLGDATLRPVDTFTPPTKAEGAPLCSKRTWSTILADCKEARLRHDHFDLPGGMARGAAVAQMLGMTLTLSGLLGGWPLAVLGAGIIGLTVAMCLARYAIQRNGRAGAGERKLEATALERHLEALRARMEAAEGQKKLRSADPEDLRRALAAEKDLKETLAMLRGGPWYVAKRLVSSTVVGPLIAGLEMVGDGVRHAGTWVKRVWDESRSSRPRSPRQPAR